MTPLHPASPTMTIEPVQVDPPDLDRPVVLRQRWAELAYFHWPYDPISVQRLLPGGVTVDTFDGQAWVGLIPFEMRDVQLGPTPPLPWVGNFHEINVRTYVTDTRGRRAVWFFSLDVPRSPVVAVARTAFALPYCWANTDHRVEHGPDGERHRYTVERRWPTTRDSARVRGLVSAAGGVGTPSADLSFRVGERIADDAVDELSHFLSARWALLTRRRRQVLRGRVHHPRWPLHRVDDVRVDQTLIEAAGLPSPVGRPHVLYSPGVDVELAWLQPVDD